LWARATITDVTGRVVAVLYDGRASSGPHTVIWDGTDSGGRAVASGVYVVSLETRRERSSKKIVLLR
jgi:flagellar hook assembly protein FlgD